MRGPFLRNKLCRVNTSPRSTRGEVKVSKVRPCYWKTRERLVVDPGLVRRGLEVVKSSVVKSLANWALQDRKCGRTQTAPPGRDKMHPL